MLFNKQFEQILHKLERLEKRLTPNRRERQFLVAYHWSNEISNKSGNSSTIITLQSDEVMDAGKIKQLQPQILERISTAGHPNDPDNVVITAVSKLGM